MRNVSTASLQAIIAQLKEGSIGILPTDTLYGIVAPALNQKAVERVYAVKGRRPDKPCIILISEISDLGQFGINPDMQTADILTSLWPGPISIVLPCQAEALAKDGLADNLEYLHRGTKTLAFRLPQNDELRDFLRETGPLIAPSANLEGKEPAHTIADAESYFNGRVDFYADGGTLEGAASTVIALENGKVKILRQGPIIIPHSLL